jgi:O-antigen/teichoic acid export membrane protein
VVASGAGAVKDRPGEMPIKPHDPEEFESPIDSTGGVPLLQLTQSRVGRIMRVLTGFLLGQGASQAISILAGLFLVRLLSVEAYAQFGVATGYQTVFSILMDSGLSASIIPLVGERVHDRAIIGGYVRAARHLRNLIFWTLAPIATVAFFATVHKYHWSWTVQIALLVSILLTLYSGGIVSLYSAPLLLFGRLREYYVPQIISGGSRLLAYICLDLGGGLNAWTAAGLGALNVALNGKLIRKASLQRFDWPEKDDPAVDRELLRYVLPATPAILFSAFQSQLTLFLVSIFGSAIYIAQVTALGRIGMLFTVLMTFNSIVIEPFIARLSRQRLPKYFVGFIFIAIVACSPFVIVAFLWPGAYLLILGTKYESVRPFMGWYVFSAYVNFISGLIWIMNRARKWVFWSGSILEVVLLLVVQIAFLTLVGVRTTQQAVFFAVVCSACYLIAHGYVTIRGFATGV